MPDYKKLAEELATMILKFSIERNREKAYENLMGKITPRARGVLKHIKSDKGSHE